MANSSTATRTPATATTAADKIYLVTGANAGLGLDATRQLALKADTKKVYLACRTKSKALKAIEDLSTKYDDIDTNKLEYIHFDASDSKEDIMKHLVDTLKSYPNEKLHGLILNAGGVGHDATGVAKGPNNILDIFQLNIVGHMHMIEGLKSKGYLIPNETVIVMSGSEVARGIPSMGMFAPTMPNTTSEYKQMIEGKTWSKSKYDPMVVYGHVKGIAALYWSEYARQNPEYHILTVSPGATKGTEAAKSESISPIMSLMFPVMLGIMNLFGGAHDVEIGAKRYVDAVTLSNGYETYESGSFIGSLKGASGKVGNQINVRKHHGAQYADVNKQHVAYKALSTY